MSSGSSGVSTTCLQSTPTPLNTQRSVGNLAHVHAQLPSLFPILYYRRAIYYGYLPYAVFIDGSVYKLHVSSREPPHVDLVTLAVKGRT